MSEKYKFDNPEGIYFVTLSIVHWIDLFTRKEFKWIMVDAIKHCQENKVLIVYAWCLMPSHLHLIISTKGDVLPGILRDFKKFTSKEIIKTIPLIHESRHDWLLNAFSKAGKDIKRIKGYKVWQDGNHPELLESNKFFDQKLDYIHFNPVEAEIVDEPENYWYSSARDCSGNKGLVNVEFIG
ncbi:MAG: transposase [Fulvivirga sp.]